MEETTLTTRIQLRLEATGLSPNAASERAGLHRDYIRNIFDEKSRNPKAEHLLKLARALECRLEWLIAGEGPETISADTLTPEEAAEIATEVVEMAFRESGFNVSLGDQTKAQLVAKMKRNSPGGTNRSAKQ